MWLKLYGICPPLPPGESRVRAKQSRKSVCSPCSTMHRAATRHKCSLTYNPFQIKGCCMSAMTRSDLPMPHKSPVLCIDDIWRLRIDQYHAMIRTGILTEDDAVELLEGCLVVKMP